MHFKKKKIYVERSRCATRVTSHTYEQITFFKNLDRNDFTNSQM